MGEGSAELASAEGAARRFRAICSLAGNVRELTNVIERMLALAGESPCSVRAIFDSRVRDDT